MNPVNLTLYLVTDSTYHTEESFLHTVEEACIGGATIVQLREKGGSSRDYLNQALKVKEITDRYHIPLIIDDRIDIALACNAAGVHVGQSDLPVSYARRLLGPDKIVGATAKTVPQALEAYKQGADYLGVGAMFPTTKGCDRTYRTRYVNGDPSYRSDPGRCHRRTEPRKYGYPERYRCGRHRCRIRHHESGRSPQCRRRTEEAYDRTS